MRKIFLCLSLISLFSVGVLAQNKKVVTNVDLEKYRQQRIQANADYERKVQEGTLPSKAELEKREQERQKFISEFSQKATAARNEAENYWQAQAYQLRTEIAAVEAEANYVRARVVDIPQQQVYYSIGSLPYGYGRGGYGGGIGNGRFPANGTSNTQINYGQIGGRLDVRSGGPLKIRVGGTYGLSSIQQSSRFGATGILTRPNTSLTFGGFPYQAGILAAPYNFQTSDSLTREELIVRLQLLEQQRAGLYARFEALQDEAQQQGVNIN
ncbi:MAG: hypothetical protein ABI954_06105 [Pyrinomonadaceae bacterium]